MIKIEKNYTWGIIDIAKFIFACLVVDLHYHSGLASLLGMSDSMFASAVCSLAVPCFFTFTGFVWMSKIYTLKDKSTVAKYTLKNVTRLLELWIPWSLFTEIFDFVESYFAPQRQMLPLKEEIHRYVVSLMNGNDRQFWFIQATISFYLLCFMFCIIANKIVMIVSFAFIYFVSYKMQFGDINSFFNMKIPYAGYGIFFAIGYIVYILLQHYPEVCRLKCAWIVGLILSYAVGLKKIVTELSSQTEYTVARADHVLPFITGCLLLALVTCFPKIGGKTKLIRKSATWIYCFQYIAMVTVHVLDKYVFHITKYIDFVLLILLFEIGTCAIAIRLQRKKYFRWLKYMM